MAWQTLLGGGDVVALTALVSFFAAARALSPAASLLVVGWLQILMERERRTTMTVIADALPHGGSAVVRAGGQEWEIKDALAPPPVLVVSQQQVR
ncbi:hypothetical protein [Streptomyces sp. NRRL S-87]|uniref:hypothetical protein n=1 Tax=Streptomyces sp. NRRL S-87 TaxID=1463920 RepID=UPI0004C13EE6|nr:hypothetical protein [Streptomyces sp. NRRL S-87]